MCSGSVSESGSEWEDERRHKHAATCRHRGQGRAPPSSSEQLRAAPSPGGAGGSAPYTPTPQHTGLRWFYYYRSCHHVVDFSASYRSCHHIVDFQACKSSADSHNSAFFDIYRVILEICPDPRIKYFSI